jgi:hypothetical protein
MSMISRVVRHKKGSIDRAILRARVGESCLIRLRGGTRYSFLERFDDGPHGLAAETGPRRPPGLSAGHAGEWCVKRSNASLGN